jgi:hypothetical protein
LTKNQTNEHLAKPMVSFAAKRGDIIERLELIEMEENP